VNRSNAGFPCAVVYGLLRALPGVPGLLAPVIGAMREHRRQLDASIGAPGPHDFAVRAPRRSSSPEHASTASRRNVRDVRNAPLIGRDGRIWITDLPDGESDLFSRAGVDINSDKSK
jgi:hypothetical protein